MFDRVLNTPVLLIYNTVTSQRNMILDEKSAKNKT